jgi:anti-sigma B factor antagonist
LKIAVDQPKSIRRITIDGRLDADGVQKVETDFKAAVAAGPNIIVDLSKVPFIASLGIRMLVAGSQEQVRLGGKMVLVGPDEVTMRILKTTGIDHLVAVRASLDEAQALF